MTALSTFLFHFIGTDIFPFVATFDPGVPCNEHGAFINLFGAPGRCEESTNGQLRLWSYRELTLRPINSDYVASPVQLTAGCAGLAKRVMGQALNLSGT